MRLLLFRFFRSEERVDVAAKSRERSLEREGERGGDERAEKYEK